MIYFTPDQYFSKMIKLGYVPSQMTNDNAKYLLKTVNMFISHLFLKNILSDDYLIEMTSGWRSVPYNIQIGGAKNSNHCVGRAIDLHGTEIIKACEKDNKLLEKFGLYAESSFDTAGWSHVQDIAPLNSNHRIFRA